MAVQPKEVICRAIEAADLEDVARLLAEGFPSRDRAYWDHALQVLSMRDMPEGYPRYGLLLQVDGVCAGVLLQIFSRAEVDAPPRCNLSSWYVAPEFRSYAAVLSSRARRHRGVTYVNTSPAEHTWPILQAQGYRRYSEGQFACLPALSLGRGARVRGYRVGEDGHPADVGALLDAHAGFGLVVLVAETAGRRDAFAFLPRDIGGLGRRVAQLAWCAAPDSFASHAGPLGRALLRRGYPLVILDGLGPVPGLVGRFFKDRAPKYYHGPVPPRLNDLAYTEAVLFGA